MLKSERVTAYHPKWIIELAAKPQKDIIGLAIDDADHMWYESLVSHLVAERPGFGAQLQSFKERAFTLIQKCHEMTANIWNALFQSLDISLLRERNVSSYLAEDLYSWVLRNAESPHEQFHCEVIGEAGREGYAQLETLGAPKSSLRWWVAEVT